jgi:hypothetical protein
MSQLDKGLVLLNRHHLYALRSQKQAIAASLSESKLHGFYLARRLHRCLQQGVKTLYASEYILALFYTLIVA